MPNPQIPTVSGVDDGGLKSLFERGKRVAEESEVGACFLDPTGLGDPQFVVWPDSTFGDWIDDPGAIMDRSGSICIPVSEIGEALAEKVQDQMPVQRHPRN